MIKTSRQLKDKIKNLAHGDSLKSQTLLRTYMMEKRILCEPMRRLYRNVTDFSPSETP